MASALSSEKIGSALFLASYDHDPGATTAVITSADGGTTKKALDLSLYGAFGVLAKPNIVGGGGLTKLEIIAADNEALTTNVVVVKDSGTIAADALSDYAFLECTAEEVAQLSAAGGYASRYVGARLTMGTNTDEATVTYIGFAPRFPRSGLTATVIA
ncbi:MAG: hypothetical protein KBD62_35700 [Kofleriaceae bacterium]|jgi:hypothetical protein|nr:hypothetical protein [Kofleriaceae bacterium]